jgi:hypothetical protein
VLTNITRNFASDEVFAVQQELRLFLDVVIVQGERAALMTSGFAKDAAFFDILAAQSANRFSRSDLHEVAERYRSISRTQCSEDISDPAHWVFRAEECRTLADQFQTLVCREQLFRLAATYDVLAGYARKQTRARGMRPRH